jgi:hypothetical protein
VVCTSDAGVEACVDTGSDTSNCGECNFVCGEGFTCNMGDCGCTFGQMLCAPDGGPIDGGDATCTNIFTAQNCGSCGNDCTVKFGPDAGCGFQGCY